MSWGCGSILLRLGARNTLFGQFSDSKVLRALPSMQTELKDGRRNAADLNSDLS